MGIVATWRKHAMGAATAALLVSGITVCGMACSCVPAPGPGVALDDADVVFAGRVVGLRLAPRLPEDPTVSFAVEDLEATFVVSSIWKGAITAETVVFTAFTCCLCGYRFEIGESYLVYATKEDGGLRTSLCTRTARLKDAGEDLAALGEPRLAVPGVELVEGEAGP